MKYHILQFLKREDGPTAVEYAVMLALIVMGCLGTIMALGNATASSFENAQTQINNAITTSSP
jgi:pilus assembly protein Flp/PilA